MKSNFLVSIIIPCYNCEKYIERTINSILNQVKYSCDIEVIFIDDGSTDNTVKIIESRMNSKEVHYKIIKKKNEGVSIARNIGINHAQGDYIYFIDSDDYIDLSLISKIENIINKNKDIDGIAFGYNRVNDKGIFWKYRDYFKYPEDTIKGYEACRLYLNGFLTLHLCSFVIKKSILDNYDILFYSDCYYGEDIEFLLKCLLKCKEVSFIKEELFNYYDRDNSVIKQFSKRRFTGINAIRRVRDTFENCEYTKNEEYLYLINKRLIMEYVYVYQSYCYYGNKKNNEMRNEISAMVLQNIDLLKSFKCDCFNDREIKKFIKHMISNPTLYAIYVEKKIKIKRMIKRPIKLILNKM